MSGLALALALAAAPSTAHAGVAHTVEPGETLWSIAAASNLTTRTLAAANGLSDDAVVEAGATIMVPSVGEGAAALQARGVTPAPQPAAPQQAAPAPQPQAPASTPAAPAGAASQSLVSAVGWQESGHNNSMVSSAGAMGIMQVMPGTWDFVEQNLGAGQLNPASSADNVRAGTLYLNHLIAQAGGDEATAIAGYYQGPESVRQHGILPETQRYVANVQALRGRFGGN